LQHQQQHQSKAKLPIKKQMKKKSNLSSRLLAASTFLPLASAALAAETNAPAVSAAWQKPAWLTDLAFGAKESYDDNLFGVADKELKPKSSWITTISPKVGLNFAPLLGDQKVLQTLSFVYSPDFNFFHGDPSQNYIAHKFGDTIKGQIDNFSFLLDNNFLYNDGNHTAPTYALNQSGAASELDQYRNNFAHAMARERLAQTQDRATVQLRYDWDKVFVRAAGSALDYNLLTYWSPLKGYQNYVDRYDINGGGDFGYKLTPKFAATLGYRYGQTYQQQLPSWVTSDQHYSSSDYQRVLFGLEGQPLNWLNVKLAGGPDFRNYNASTPVADHNPVKYYGEAVLTATITPSQTLTFGYKQWQWVSSTGKVPEFDSSYTLNYHWNATKQLGVDLGGKVLEADFTQGNDYAGTAPSARDDMEYELSAGVTYAFTTHLSANLSYTYDLGDTALSANRLPTTSSDPQLSNYYRDFECQVVSLGLQYKF